jgi:hypothetical protein
MKRHRRTVPWSGFLVAFPLLCVVLAAPPQQAAQRQSPAPSTRADVVETLRQLQAHQADLDGSHAVTEEAAKDLVRICKGLSGLVDDALKMSEVALGARPGSRGPTDSAAVTKNIREMQMSFNLQYLMLQNKVAHENRQFSMVSNIMKNKHDTAKNSIKNIR